MDQLFSLIITFIIGLGIVTSNAGNVPAGQLDAAVNSEVQTLANIGEGYESLCIHTNFQCDDVATNTPIVSGQGPVEPGYVPAIPKPRVGVGATYNIQVAPSQGNALQNNVATYSTAQVLGALISTIPVYTVTANGAGAPTVSVPTTTAPKTLYTLVYDKCLSGVYATTAAVPVPACP